MWWVGMGRMKKEGDGRAVFVDCWAVFEGYSCCYCGGMISTRSRVIECFFEGVYYRYC